MYMACIKVEYVYEVDVCSVVTFFITIYYLFLFPISYYGRDFSAV